MAGRRHRRRMRGPRRRRILHARPPRPGRNPERIRLALHRRARVSRPTRRQHLFQRLLPRRARPHVEVGAGAGEDHLRRSVRRHSRSLRNSARSPAISISTPPTSTRCRAKSASTTHAAPKKPRSTSTRASRILKAARSTPPPDTKSSPTRTDLSANIAARIARSRPSPSRKSENGAHAARLLVLGRAQPGPAGISREVGKIAAQRTLAPAGRRAR